MYKLHVLYIAHDNCFYSAVLMFIIINLFHILYTHIHAHIHAHNTHAQVVSILHLVSFHTSYNIDYMVLCILMLLTVLNPFLYMLVRASIRKILISYLKNCLHLFVCYKCRKNRKSKWQDIRELINNTYYESLLLHGNAYM